MNCMHCHGLMEKGSVPFHVDRKGYHLSLDSVPAWVCGQCGEPFFGEAEVDLIQQLLLDIDVRANQLSPYSEVPALAG